MSVSDEIIKILDALSEKFGMAIDWTSQNIIPYLEQLSEKFVKYEIGTSAVWMIFGICCLVVGNWGIGRVKYCYNRYKEDVRSYWDGMAVLAGFGVCAAIITGIIVVMFQTLQIVTCLTFPEKLILEELKTIYSNMN